MPTGDDTSARIRQAKARVRRMCARVLLVLLWDLKRGRLEATKSRAPVSVMELCSPSLCEEDETETNRCWNSTSEDQKIADHRHARNKYQLSGTCQPC